MKTALKTGTGIALLALSFALSAEAQSTARKKILFFTKSATAEHAAIKAGGAGKPAGIAFAVLSEIGTKHNIEFTFSKDGSLFDTAYLAQFDAFCFFTTGDLTQPAKDGSPAMPPEGKAALLKAIADGKGFIGIHAASDTFHSAGHQGAGKNSTQPEGDRDEYIQMVGGEFIIHGAQQPARQIVADANFPGVSQVPADFGPNEEWYAHKNFAPDLHVILVQDTSNMTGAMYQRPNFPSTWARMQGKGRVFYTSMGHRDDVWTHPAFQSVLEGGIDWALRRVDADVTPNLSTVTPNANELSASIVPDKKPAKGKAKAN